jgi:hypothetical protein
MATTTNYGWTTPDDTALVKDGAAAIRTLGSSVDTTTKALNPSTTLGDIEYRSATANTNTRLGIGTAGQVLTVASGVPSWATPSAGMTNPMTTTGDTIYSSSGSTPARLGIGSTGQVLSVSGGVPAWTTPSSGSLTQLATGTFSGSSVSLTSISGSYRDLRLVTQNLYFSATETNLMFQVNSTSGIYSVSYSGVGYTDLTSTSAETARMSSSNTNSYGLYEFPDYTGSSFKVILTQWLGRAESGGTPYYFLHRGLAGIRTTSAITSIQMTPSTGTFSGGTYTLYGVN